MEVMTGGTDLDRVPAQPRQGDIWWSAAPPAPPDQNNQGGSVPPPITDAQLNDWLSSTAGWKALELTWGAVQSCDVRHSQLKPLLQAAMAEAARLGAKQLVVRQLDVDEVVGRCLALGLSGFPNFTAFKLRELNLYDEALGHLSGALHSAEHLTSMVLDTVWASAGGWAALAAALKVNSSITSLRLRHCLTADGPALAALCGALGDQRGASLESLKLANNTLGDEGVGELCKALARSCGGPSTTTHYPTRVALADLSHTSATGQCVPAVAAMLRAVRTLRHLDLSYNQLGPEGARELCRSLAYAPYLTTLRLAATGADDSAVEALVRSITSSTSSMSSAAAATTALVGGSTVGSTAAASGWGSCLAVVSFAHNRLTSRGAAALAAGAKRPSGCSLADVDLSGNGQVGEAGAKAWAEALSSPGGGSRLTRLLLNGCEVTDEGAYAVGAALKGNTTLTELGLAENHISTSGLALLAEVVKVNGTLRVLDVSLNMVGPQGMRPFTSISHLRGHVMFSKAKDHAVQRVSSCLVKGELLPEYRVVEAVKQNTMKQPGQPWGETKLRVGLGTPGGNAGDPHGSWGADDYLSPSNPFLDPGTPSDPPAASNPFLSPAASYINPFLDPPNPSAVPGPSTHDAVHNPFLEPPPPPGGGAGDSNPFLSPRARPAPGRPGGPENPFLSPPDAASAVSGGEEEPGPRAVGERQLATRVLTRLGPRSGGGSGGGGGGSGSGGGGGSGSGSVYVSSRSTADEGDLVTDLDLRLVDHLIETLGFRDSQLWQRQPQPPQAPAPQPLPVPQQHHHHVYDYTASARETGPPPQLADQLHPFSSLEDRAGGASEGAFGGDADPRVTSGSDVSPGAHADATDAEAHWGGNGSRPAVDTAAAADEGSGWGRDCPAVAAVAVPAEVREWEWERKEEEVCGSRPPVDTAARAAAVEDLKGWLRGPSPSSNEGDQSGTAAGASGVPDAPPLITLLHNDGETGPQPPAEEDNPFRNPFL